LALSPKMVRFIEEYPIDLNGAKAAIRAGYSERTAKAMAGKLMANPEIRAAIDTAIAERGRRNHLTQDMVVRELRRIGFADIRKLVRWGAGLVVPDPADPDGDEVVIRHGVQAVPSDEIDDDTAAAIVEVSQTKDGTVRFKLADKRAALVDLGKHLGMFRERVELTGPGGGPIETDNTLRIEFVRPKKGNGNGSDT
jgi:phage terminase small subunit